MRSARPKVLHAIAGRSLLAHVLDAVRDAGGTMTAVVVGPDAEPVAAEARRVLPAPKSSCRRSGAEPRMPCWRRESRSRAGPTTCS